MYFDCFYWCSGKIDIKPDEPIWNDAGYSFGARQTVYRMFKNVSGFAILDHHTRDSYWVRVSSSIFWQVLVAICEYILAQLVLLSTYLQYPHDFLIKMMIPPIFTCRLCISLAAAGWGWGGRMKVSVTRGCIPVIVQDGILVEFEEQLPMKEYAIRVPMWMVHKMPDILNTFISSGRVTQMQKTLECAWRLHWWRRAAGRPGIEQGRAFEVVRA